MFQVVTFYDRHKSVTRLWAKTPTREQAREVLTIAVQECQRRGYQVEWVDEDTAEVAGYGTLTVLEVPNL